MRWTVSRCAVCSSLHLTQCSYDPGMGRGRVQTSLCHDGIANPHNRDSIDDWLSGSKAQGAWQSGKRDAQRAEAEQDRYRGR